MAVLKPIVVRQPRPEDLVDDPVKVCGIGTGFEGSFSARVRDADGNELKLVPIQAGGMGIWGNFQVEIDIPRPRTPKGRVEVFEFSARDGSEINKVSVPVVFGRALIDPYHGFAQYSVRSGDTLAEIAQRFYGDSGRWRAILEANRDQIFDPDRIFPGQVLRVPQ